MANPFLFRFIGPDQLEWLENSKPRQGSATACAAAAQAQRPILIAPSESLTLTSAQAPSRNRTAWLKAIAYALEDSLAEDVETLHYAVGASGTNGLVPIAVLRRSQLQSWLDDCAQAGLAPAAVVPDCLLLPLEAESWSVLLEQRRALVRTGVGSGFATERDNVATLLQLALAEADADAPAILAVWGEPGSELSSLGPEWRVQATPTAALAVLAAGFPGSIDLLQGEFSRTLQVGQWLRPWRAAALLALLYLGLQLVLPVGEFWRLQREQADLRTAQAELLQTTVPSTRRIVNPRAQLENHLRELQRGDNGDSTTFIQLLGQSGAVLKQFPQLQLQGLRYRTEQLDIDLAGGALETLDQLKARLQSETDLQIELRASQNEGQVESRLRLRSPAS